MSQDTETDSFPIGRESDLTPSEGEGREGSTYRPIGEVAALLRLQPHVLRFWETKFKQIAPLKRSGGRRYYRREDVRLLFLIRDLLYVEGYTLRGAQRALRERARSEKVSQKNETRNETRVNQRGDEEKESSQESQQTSSHEDHPAKDQSMSPASRADLERLAKTLEKALALCSEADTALHEVETSKAEPVSGEQ